jgi:hypothetical protein
MKRGMPLPWSDHLDIMLVELLEVASVTSIIWR